MAKKNNDDFSDFFEVEKEVTSDNNFSDFFEVEKEVSSKKKSQSQSGSSTEESSSGTSETKKEQSSGTTKPLSLEEKKALARKQKSSNINWDVDKETEQAFKGVATKEERKAQAKQEAISVGETFMPNIEEKSKAREIQSQAKEIKPELDTQRKLKAIPQEDLKAIFEGDNELTMFDGGQRLAEKYNLTEEEIEKAQKKYLNDKVTEFKRKDLESSLDLITKYAPAPKDFKDITAYTQNIELLNKAKEMSFEKNKNLSFSLMDLDDNQRKVVDEYSSVMDRLNSYKEKSFVQKQGEDGSMVINPKEVAQFEKDLKESQRLSKEIDKIRGNNNRLFDELSNVINKDTDKPVTQESFTSKYNNDYMKLKGALEDATYKLNYLEKEARGIRDAEREGGRMLTDAQLTKQNAKLSNIDRERNLAKAEVLALSNALFLNEDITKKVIKPDETVIEKTLNVFRDVAEGYSQEFQKEVFNTTSTSEKNQARILNDKLKEVGIDLKGIDEKLKPTFSEKLGSTLSTSTVLGAKIAATSVLTAGVGTVVRGAGLLPKVFELYDKGGKFAKIADVVISGINFELASDQTSFAMGAGEQGAQLVFEKIAGKFKPLNPLIGAISKTLVGASGITIEEYAGDLFDNLVKTGISQETFDSTFGKSQEEGMEKLALTFAMGMMSGGKQGAVLMVGAFKEAKAKNATATTVTAMQEVLNNIGLDPDDVIASLKAEAETKSDRVYPDGKGGQLRASNMTVEQEIVLREKLNYKPLTEDELTLKRTVQETEELAPSDSPYVTKKEMDDDLKLLKGEDEGSVPETYVGESVKTDEGIVTTVTEKVEEGTQLRVPVEQLVVEEAKPISETFDRAKAGVIDVWQDTETNELFVINGTKRVATALEDGTSSVDVNFVKANSLEEAYKIGELKNKLEDTDKTIDAVEDNTNSDIAYHGTPYNYNKFDASKIGTGEGASKQGRGLYLKRSKVNAPFYANINSEDAPKHLGSGKSKVDKSTISPHILTVSGISGLNLKKGSFKEVSKWAKNQEQYENEGYDGFEADNGDITVFPKSINKVSINKKATLNDFVAENAGFEFREWTTEKGKENAIIQAELKNKLEDTDKTIDAVELIKANPTLKDNLDLSKPKELELFGLASLNESLTEELKSNPNQAGVLSIIGNSVPIQNQDSVYEVVKRIGLTAEQTSVLVKMPEVKNATKTFVDNKQKALSSIEETTKALDEYEQENEPEFINLQKLFNLGKGYAFDSGAAIEWLQKLARKGNKMGNVKKPSSLKFLPKKITLKHLVRNSKDKKSILKEGFNFNKLDNDSNVPGAYFSSEDWSTVGRFGREQQNALFVDIENEGLVYFDTAEDFEAFLEENGINSNKGLSFEEIKPLLDLGIKGILLKEDVVSRQRNELIVIDGSIIKGISENQKDINNLPSSFPSTKSVAQEYHKVKKDGTNPALVEAVESIFTDDKSYQDNKKTKEADEQLKAKVELKTALTKTGQSNIDSLSEDAAQLGLESETLYDRILSTSPTVKALTERYAKGVSSGLYSVKEATNRLNAEIKENLGKITEEMNMNATKKDVAQLESALTSNKKNSSEILRDIASKLDKAVDNIGKNSYTFIFGVEPLIAKAFLKGLSVALKSSATFMDAFNKAIKKIQSNAEFKKLTMQEKSDVITNITNALNKIKNLAELKNPITNLQQNKIKQTVEARIKHLYQTQMTSLPSLTSLEKMATKYGITDANAFAQKLYGKLDKLEQTRAKRMESFEGAISDYITKGGGNVKSLFNRLSDLILKDKQQAVTLKNTVISVMNNLNAKGFKLNPSQFTSIINAFNKADLSNLNGLYELSFKIERVIAKAMDIKVNNDIKDLQSSIKSKYKKLPKKQLEVFARLVNINPNNISSGNLKDRLLESLLDIKQYINSNDNLQGNLGSFEALATQLEAESEKYIEDKLQALAEKSYNEFKKFTNTSMTLAEYIDIIYNPSLDAKREQAKIDSDNRKDAKRIALEMLTFNNITNLLNINNAATLSPISNTLELKTFVKFQETLKELLNENMIPKLTDTELKEINQVYTEYVSFNSFSKLGTISNRLSGVLKAYQNKNFITDSFRDFSGIVKRIFAPKPFKLFGKEVQTVSLGQLFSRLSYGFRAKELFALMTGDFNLGINIAKTEFKKFNTKFEEVIKFNIGTKENLNLGAKAYFLTSPADLDVVDAQLLFEKKKDKLARDIAELERIANDKGTGGNKSKKSSAKERAKTYQEALDEINKYDTYEEYVKAYEDGSLLSETQYQIFELAKSEYEKQEGTLVSSNSIYGGEPFIKENLYTSTAYLRSEEAENKDDLEQLVGSKVKSKSVKDTRSGTTFAKVDPDRVASDKILDFNFIDVTQRRVLENYIDMHTRGAVIELNAFLNADPFIEIFRDMNILSTHKYMKQRIGQWAINETSFNQSLLDNSKSNIEKVEGFLQNIKKAKLNTLGQFVKQPTVLAHTFSRFGEDFIIGSKVFAELLLKGGEGKDLLSEIMLGSDVSNRSPLGDEQITKALGRQKAFDLSDKEFYRWMQKFYAEPLKATIKPLDNNNLSGKVASVVSAKKAMEVGDFAMVASDVISAQITYISALINTIKRDNPGISITSVEDIIKYKNSRNTIIADMLSAEINNESASSKQGNLMLGKDHKILANLFFMFQSHAMNVSHAATNSLLDILDTKADKMDRVNGVAALVGYTSAIILFRTFSEVVGLAFNQLYDEIARELGYKDPREKEERPRLNNLLNSEFREEALTRIGLNSFADVMFSKSPSGIQNFVKGKTNDSFKNTYMFFNREQYEGNLPYESSPMEYSGVINVGVEFLASTYKIFAPPLEKDEDMLNNMKASLLLKKQFKSYAKDPIGTAVDLGYSILTLYGKGEPAKMFGNIQKVREREFIKDKKERVGLPSLLFRDNNKKN